MFERVVIVGVGLLGASLGLALKARGLARRVVGVGRAGSLSVERALQRGAIDEVGGDLGTVLDGFGTEKVQSRAGIGRDLVVLCAPVRQFRGLLEELRNMPGDGRVVVTDVGSTKGEVMGWAKEILGEKGKWFVGSHPMAGSEKRGPEAGRADLYEGAVCLICRPEGSASDEGAVERVEAMWQAVGMRTVRVGARAHDRWVATISHLPHAVAFSLVNAAAKDPQALQAVANGFLDTTRVASSDVEMWTDIFLTNRGAVVDAIDTFAADLSALRAAVANGDEGSIRAAIAAAKKTRDELVARRRPGSGE
ncbi:MAG: prephenate dehydrogenase [Phycisphaerae bacterium]